MGALTVFDCFSFIFSVFDYIAYMDYMDLDVWYPRKDVQSSAVLTRSNITWYFMQRLNSQKTFHIQWRPFIARFIIANIL